MINKIPIYKTGTVKYVPRIVTADILPRFNELVKSRFNDKKAQDYLLRFSDVGGELANTSPLMLAFLASSGLRPETTHLATRKDLELIMKKNPAFLQGKLVDFGVAIRSAGDSYTPNNLLAQTLAQELKYRGMDLGSGKLIPFYALGVSENTQSPEYGLVFELNERVNKHSVLDLKAFKWNGIRKEGLACAYLDPDGIWDSSNLLVGDVCSAGRLVEICSEGAQKII